MADGAGEPKVRIDQVALAATRPGGLSDRDLDHPQPGDTSDAYALRVGGWAIGDGQPVTGFELAHQGIVLETVPAIPSAEDEHGARMELAVSSLELPYEFRVTARAVLKDRSRARVAILAGTRAALPPGPAHGPVPVLVTTIGRSGSTAVTNLLCHHPDCTGYRPWDTETRMVSYWASVLRGLARPGSYERQLEQPLGPGFRYWWAGEPRHHNLPHDDPALPALGREGVEGVVSFCRDQIGRMGTLLAQAAGKPAARFIVEKAQPEKARSVAEVVEELDPRTREIVLVRDLRDTVCSMRAYTEKTGVIGFGPRGDSSVEGSIRWLSNVSAKTLVDYIERRGAAAHLLRYEDLIERPEATLTAVLDFIGASASPAIVEQMLTRLAAERERREAHATTGSAEDSVGRWRREFSKAEQAVAEEVFGPQLEALGYR